MRIAIVSDIHGNRRAFDAVLADLREVAPDLIVHGGDLSSGGAHPAEIIDQIQSLDWPGVCGNTDEMLYAPNRLTEFAATLPQLAAVFQRVEVSIPWTVNKLGADRLRWLEKLPIRYLREDLTLVHASPNDRWRAPAPNATEDEFRKVYAPLNTKTVVYAHIHVPFIRHFDEWIVANTGSVSQSYDGDTRASYLVVDDERLTTRRVEYDVQAEADDLLQSGVPHADWMAKILLAGKYVAPE
ncbi:MAG TPA: metallophosphoesterase family protein [Candidatus Eremiobacteraceae bacterium]|jgi:putative phosphoesterase|nr:metallophosphoesterase family protein [Candidatus Eremiobacteraceae bacterium]